MSEINRPISHTMLAGYNRYCLKYPDTSVTWPEYRRVATRAIEEAEPNVQTDDLEGLESAGVEEAYPVYE